MSTAPNKTSGLKAPAASKITRPSGLPQPRSTNITPAGSRSQSPEPLPPAVPTDDFIIGDRVWVSGTKPGLITFIGETQFAAGDWVGVVLDEPVGKNDGSVAGVRYFQCPMNRGVFARITKISRTAQTDAPSKKILTSATSSSSSQSTQLPTSPKSQSNGIPSALSSSTTSIPKFTLGNRSLSGSNTSLNPSMTTSQVGRTNSSDLPQAGMHTSMKIGDRVMVHGTKAGVLRFLGTADFAQGFWCGVELNEALGKNDGSVAGKRYFTCKPKFGLFAPMHKVTRISATTPQLSTPLSKHGIPVSGSRLSRQRSGSQDSISSLSSMASSVSRSRVKPTTSRNILSNSAATTSALQKAVKEKDEHIQQLLRERELERSEVARAAAHVDEAESELVKSKTEFTNKADEYEDTIQRLKDALQQRDDEYAALQAKCDEEKRRVEDLQFEIAEESMCKDDLEQGRTENDQAIVIELQQELKLAHEQSVEVKLERDSLLAELEQSKQHKLDVQKCREQIADLTAKLRIAQQKARDSDVQSNTRNTQATEELNSHIAKLTDLQTELTQKCQYIQEIEVKLTESKEHLINEENKTKKLQSSLSDLTIELQDRDTKTVTLQTEVQDLKSKLTELQHLLEENSTKTTQLREDNARQERQLKELLENSGNNSQQVMVLNEQLAQRDRTLAETQAELTNSTREVNNLNVQLEELRSRHDNDTKTLTEHHHQQSGQLETRIQSLETELDKKTTKLEQQTEQHKTELETLTQKHETFTTQANTKIESQNDLNVNLTNQLADKTHALESLNIDLQNIKKERETTDQNYKEARQHYEQAANEVTTLKQQLNDEYTKHEAYISRLKEEHVSAVSKIESYIVELKSQLEAHQQQRHRESQQETETRQRLENELAEITESRHKSENELATTRQQLQATADEARQERDIELAKIEELRKNHQFVEAKLCKSKETIESMTVQFNDCQSAIEQLNSDVTLKDDKILDLENDITTLRFQNEVSQNEQFELYEKIAQLEESLVEIRETTNAQALGDSTLATFEQEKKDYENQIEFLNGVIAEIQHKYEKAKKKIHKLQNPELVNGEETTAKRITPPPRLFCDICEVFDLHETDDCPLQAMSDSPPASHHNGPRGEQRPYCDACELFGHWTEECDDEQTF